MPTAPTPASGPPERDPHDPEDAAALVADELVADRGHAKDDRVFQEAQQAARAVEEEEDTE